MCRMFIPRSERRQFLSMLRSTHLSGRAMWETARKIWHWSGLKHECHQWAKACEVCKEQVPSETCQEPMLMDDVMRMVPMELLGVDLMNCEGNMYLVGVDKASGFKFASYMAKTTTEAVTLMLEAWFCRYGIQNCLRIDRGMQFCNEFAVWSGYIGNHHELASAYNPESNGLAESRVKQVKTLIKKTEG